MAVLLGIAPDEVPPLAKPIIDDSHADAQLRRSALRKWLMAQKPAAGEKEAVARLMGGDPALRRIALVYLSQGPQGLQYLKGELLAIRTRQVTRRFHFTHLGRTDRGRGARGPQARASAPVTARRGPGNCRHGRLSAGYAGRSRRPGTARQIFAHESSEGPGLEPLVYRAIAALNDPHSVPVLAEIFKHREEIDVRDFYWTIRTMKGPEILALRKQIRDEVGMDHLQ